MRPNLFQEDFPSSECLFSSILEGFSLHIYYFSWLGEFLKEGALSLGDLVSWRVRYHITTEGSHHMCFTSPYRKFYINSQGFAG
jgi:hypothetical protein